MWFSPGVMRTLVLVLIIVATFTGFFLSMNVYRLGLEAMLAKDGATWTIISGLGLVPVLVVLAFLFDSRHPPGGY